MRNMSFALTTDQVRDQSKTVTRRFGWWNLKPGELVQPVKKSMGLQKGESIEKLGPPIRVKTARAEPLSAVYGQPQDMVKEGFPNLTPAQFVAMLTRHYGRLDPNTKTNRIEFEYTTPPPDEGPEWTTPEMDFAATPREDHMLDTEHYHTYHKTLTFDGATADQAKDAKRLTGQWAKVFALMKDGTYRTLAEIEEATGYPQASISARLRDFRKERFGQHTVNRRRRGKGGTWEYQLEVNATELLPVYHGSLNG